MYRFKHRNHSQRSNFRLRTNKSKKLNPGLFIKKAHASNRHTDHVSTARFADYDVVDILKRNIGDHGYTIPTAIQEKSIPQILAGRDIIGLANTGSGKTAAFLISLINKSYLHPEQRALIVVPTRELAVQIRDEFCQFSKDMNLRATVVIGGANIRHQIHALSQNPHFVIGTPGRLKDLIVRGKLNLIHFQNIVLDEVDRMVDIGFIQEIRYLISLLPPIRQSLFFSATVDDKTRNILQNFVTNPLTITVKQQEIANIDQNIVRLTGRRSKVDTLHDLLNRPGFDKVLIFGRTKWGMEKLSRDLVNRGFKASAIHSNKSQFQRQRALEEFKNNQSRILLATDIASRGLDIEDITHVINYDPPATYDDYIHRIGRTGRAGKRGIALTFVE